jgi:hypothetical protein
MISAWVTAVQIGFKVNLRSLYAKKQFRKGSVAIKMKTAATTTAIPLGNSE